MAKAPAKDPFRCVECGWSATKWVGRCGEQTTAKQKTMTQQL